MTSKPQNPALFAAVPRLVIRCQKHPSYTGLSKPRPDCDACESVHSMRGAAFERKITHGKRAWVTTRIGWGAQ